MVFPVVMDRCESWTIKKAEHRRIDALKLWSWWRLLWVPWTARRSNQSILKEISPEYSLEGLMLKLKLQYFGHLLRRTDSFEKTLVLGKIEGRKRRGRQRMRWLDSITGLMDISLSKLFRSWWWTGRLGMLQSMGSLRVGHDWTTELNSTFPASCLESALPPGGPGSFAWGMVFRDHSLGCGLAYCHWVVIASAAKSLQSCLTLCDPIDGSPPGSPIPGILQARILEVGCHFLLQCVKVKLLSQVRLLATPWTATHQAPPSIGFSRQEYWSGVPLPSPVIASKGLK